MMQQKGPRVMGAIIENNQVILLTRDIENKGGLVGTMYEVKGLDNAGRGTRKAIEHVD
jgi:hypothetical protein